MQAGLAGFRRPKKGVLFMCECQKKLSGFLLAGAPAGMGGGGFQRERRA
nr:MAG TPA: hypothetical protein [Caudoviricetes sp.]